MRKILIVEDEDVLRETYDMILSTEPYLVETAANGEEAFNKCLKESFDLVLLDLMMPILDGVGFLNKLHEHGGVLPKIIILSNLSSGTELEQALKLGAQHNILKAALTPKELLTTVRYEVDAV